MRGGGGGGQTLETVKNLFQGVVALEEVLTFKIMYFSQNECVVSRKVRSKYEKGSGLESSKGFGRLTT